MIILRGISWTLDVFGFILEIECTCVVHFASYKKRIPSILREMAK